MRRMYPKYEALLTRFIQYMRRHLFLPPLSLPLVHRFDYENTLAGDNDYTWGDVPSCSSAIVITSENKPVRWTTPLGLPVVQPYRKPGRHLVRTSL
ncbi:hypothetical protein C5167_012803 [Papaver somniferum]|uniref:DNA-directed RNA polymerase n=1 Tax=Papaver somniferum TaxID=3469 RepID=A0A4Y7IYJ4_PAPSO|nr:hypothetical protein C5167_012803 [Papaver somniferum]